MILYLLLFTLGHVSIPERLLSHYGRKMTTAVDAPLTPNVQTNKLLPLILACVRLCMCVYMYVCMVLYVPMLYVYVYQLLG